MNQLQVFSLGRAKLYPQTHIHTSGVDTKIPGIEPRVSQTLEIYIFYFYVPSLAQEMCVCGGWWWLVFLPHPVVLKSYPWLSNQGSLLVRPWGNHMGSQELNPGQQCAKQLYYC